MKRCLLRNKTSIFQRRLKKKEKLSLAASFKRNWGKSGLSLAEILARIFLRSKDVKNQANGIAFRQYRSERRGSLSPSVLAKNKGTAVFRLVSATWRG